MEKIYGTPIRQDGLQRIGPDTWLLYFGLYETSDGSTYEYRQTFKHKPTLDEIKKEIVSAIKEESAHRLRYGLQWNGLPVEYTEERKSDLTGIIVGIQSGFVQLPIEINLGSAEDGMPSIYTFTTAEEISDVAALIAGHKTAVAKAEWNEINALDLEVFTTEK